MLYRSKNNKLLVFCSKEGLEILSKSTHLAGDGTFHTASKYFYQLYIIQAYYEHRMIPCVWALMHRRREVDYDKVFKAIAKEAKEQKLKIRPNWSVARWNVRKQLLK